MGIMFLISCIILLQRERMEARQKEQEIEREKERERRKRRDEVRTILNIAVESFISWLCARVLLQETCMGLMIYVV